MRIVVFGGAGFLGNHVVNSLTASGHEVVIYDIKEPPHRLPEQSVIVDDILNQAAVEEAVTGCDVIYNFAGIADIDECDCRPGDTVKYNILGNVIALEAARKTGVKRFVFASSVYIYSNSGSFYRCSKQACESYIENYRSLYGLPYTILRYGSLYGEGADERNSIYRIIRDALLTGEIIYHGSGEEVREYIHVKDAANLSVQILEPAFENEHVILTGNQSIKYKELLEMIKEMLGNKVEIIYRPKQSNTHYKLTPYSFSPKIGKKLVNNPHIDMGQGLLNCMTDIYKKFNIEKQETMGLLLNNQNTGMSK